MLFPVLLAKRKKTGAMLLCFYVVTYVIFSLNGRYVVANHGGMDWRREWCPKYLVVEYVSYAGRAKTAFTVLGTFFWPCIVLDQFLWHRTSEAKV